MCMPITYGWLHARVHVPKLYSGDPGPEMKPQAICADVHVHVHTKSPNSQLCCCLEYCMHNGLIIRRRPGNQARSILPDYSSTCSASGTPNYVQRTKFKCILVASSSATGEVWETRYRYMNV